MGRTKAWEGKRAGFDLARAGTRLRLCSNPAEPGLVRSPGTGKRKPRSLRVEAGRAHPEHLRGSVTIVIPIYRIV
jgi:hypothetical protein